MATQPMRHKSLLFQGYARVTGSGYGSAYQNLVVGLLTAGVDLLNPEADTSDKVDVQVYFGQPDRRWQNKWKRRADHFGIFTMFETEALPPFWVEDINEHFDFVLVPSTWCKEVFENVGILKPVHVVPLGVCPEIFPYLNRPKRQTFTILWQGFHEKDRKGYALLRQAFDELDLPDSVLIKKFSPFSLMSPVQYEFRRKYWSICKNMTQAEMLMLLRDADLSVNPTAGEGFGLIPLEHMATGLPVLVSKNSGCLDYVDEQFNVGIECKEGLSWFGPEYGKMMVPDYEDLKAKILWAYEHRQEAADMGYRASNWVREFWTYEKATARLLEVLDGFVS